MHDNDHQSILKVRRQFPITNISSTLTNFGSSLSDSLIKKQLFALYSTPSYRTHDGQKTEELASRVGSEQSMNLSGSLLNGEGLSPDHTQVRNIGHILPTDNITNAGVFCQYFEPHF